MRAPTPWKISPMPLYDFHCDRCDLAITQTKTIANRNSPDPCDKCGDTPRRVVSSPTVLLDGTDPGYPTAAAKWEKDRYRRMAQEKKNLREHGTER